MNALPKISCFCCTYNRPELLEEAIQSFLMQDYPGPKELVIVNDCAEQTLVFRHPLVRIVNVTHRFEDIAAKHRFALSLCSGPLYKVWDDDDIHLPHALSTIAAGQKDGIYKTDLAFIDDNPTDPSIVRGPLHNNFAFCLQAYVRMGYYVGSGASFDMRLIAGLATMTMQQPFDQPAEGPFYLYRKFSGAAWHISELKCADDGLNERVDAANGEIQRKGEIVLQPKWSRDWSTIAAAAWSKKKTPQPIWALDKSFASPPHAKTPVEPAPQPL